MSDPIDKLTSLGDALEGAPMPLPASAIRARGDRIRRRKHAIVATASAAVVAAVAVPVVALTLNGSDEPDDKLAPQPSISDPVPAAALTAENLITADDAAWNEVGTEFEVSETYPGDGQAPPSPCFESSFAGLGAETVFKRDFAWTMQTSGADLGPQLNEIIGEFASPEEAQAAYDEIQGWYDECLPPGAERFDAGEFAPVPIPVDGQATQMLATYGPVDEELDPFGDEAWFLDTGVVVSGDRVAVVTALSHGQDYANVGPPPAEKMVPAAAERLVLGNGVDQGPTEIGGDWPTTIPDGFPLDSGRPEDDGSSEFQLDPPSADNQAMLPAGDLDACDQAVDGGDPGSRLTTRIDRGSTQYVRELQLFADPDEAAAYLDSVQDAFAACEAAGPTTDVPSFTTEVNQGSIGEESWVVTRASDGIGRVVINVLRVGNAVVVDLASDEGTGDTVVDLATETRENLADVIAAMNDLQGGGSAPADPADPADPGAPSGTTEIPDEFPLASYLAEPPTPDSETAVTGPEAGLRAVGDLPICGVAALPTEPQDRLGYSVAGIEYGDQRELRTYGTANEAVAELQALRDLLATCDREPTETDGWSNVWQVFEDADPGYDSVTWGYTSEMDGSDSFAGSGQLMTAVRVGNSILVIAWYAEYNRDSMERNVSNLLETVALITPAMCVFTSDGC